jgi:hypothetical protein
MERLPQPAGLRHAETIPPLADLSRREDEPCMVNWNLIAKAEKYRGYAGWISDSETARRILKLASELEKQALRPDEEDIRTRAYDLWRQAGEPEDRDLEFWLLAEQELYNDAVERAAR